MTSLWGVWWCMYQGVQILSTVYIVLLGRLLSVHARHLEIKLRQGNGQTYIGESKSDRICMKDTYPPSRRPYELAEETIQSNCSWGPDSRFFNVDSTTEILSMDLGTCSLIARFHSLMRERFMSNKMNSRLSRLSMVNSRCDCHMTRYEAYSFTRRKTANFWQNSLYFCHGQIYNNRHSHSACRRIIPIARSADSVFLGSRLLNSQTLKVPRVYFRSLSIWVSKKSFIGWVTGLWRKWGVKSSRWLYVLWRMVSTHTTSCIMSGLRSEQSLRSRSWKWGPGVRNNHTA